MAKKRLSPPMIAMLKNSESGFALTKGLSGRSRIGAADGTRFALFARGLITRTGAITPEGSDALRAERAKGAA